MQMKKTKTQVAMSLLASLGGKATLKKYGKKHFKALAVKANLAKAKKRKLAKKLSTS